MSKGRGQGMNPANQLAKELTRARFLARNQKIKRKAVKSLLEPAPYVPGSIIKRKDPTT